MNELIIAPGFTVSTWNQIELSQKLGSLVTTGGFSCAVNAEKYWLHSNYIISEELSAASIRIADGASVLLVAKLRHNVQLEKIDFPKICIAHACRNMTPLGLIGGEKEVSVRALHQLRLVYPSLPLFGQHGYGSLDDIRCFLNKNFSEGAGIILLGLGSPKQEKIAHKLSKEFPNLFFVCCGGAIANLAGEQRRAPIFIQKSNFEWLYRLLMNPRTRLKRVHRLLPIAFLIFKLFLRIEK